MKCMGDAEPSEHRRRVLIVDDDQDFGDSLVDVLSGHNYDPVTVNTPEGALAAIREHAAAVAMLDIRLGVTSGVDLLSQLKAEHPNLICVMMTAHIDTATAIRALRNGAYDYFDKTCEVRELLAVLDRCYEKLLLQEETRKAYEALRLAKDAAEVANRAKSEFLASMSHELRTPLNAVMGFSETMLKEILGPLNNESYRQYVKHIYESADHLLEIINDILDVSKAEAGKLELVEEEIDVKETIDAACELIKVRAEAGGVELICNTPDNLPRIYADQRKLKQIVLNLLSNAVKFTPVHGRVEISSALRPGAGLVIVVRDTGIGIAKSDIPRVLEPFVQVESSLSRRHEGTGLGLPLVDALTRLHGGQLRIESNLGAGTVVTVTFPPHRVVLAQFVTRMIS